MIALDKLICNIHIYDDMYKKMGYNIDLNKILTLENLRKNLQLEYEDLKSKCNKMCNDFAIKRQSKEPINELYNEIILTDSKLKLLKKELDNYNKIINKNLNRLPNLPEKFIAQNTILSTSNKSINENEFINFIDSFDFKKVKSTLKIEQYIKTISNQLFHEDQASQIIFCSNGILILTPDFNVDNMLFQTINFLKQNSYKVIEDRTVNLNKSSIAQFSCHISTSEIIKISLVKEFFTRCYNIKYKNKNIDMTKFVNQINIKIKRKR